MSKQVFATGYKMHPDAATLLIMVSNKIKKQIYIIGKILNILNKSLILKYLKYIKKIKLSKERKMILSILLM